LVLSGAQQPVPEPLVHGMTPSVTYRKGHD
jgi:hypothetical protein